MKISGVLVADWSVSDTSAAVLSPNAIKVAATAIAPHVRQTPTLEVPGSEIGLDATLVVKLEFLQHSGTFKGRGACHFVATQSITDAGIVAASGGNHGAAAAWAAQHFGHAAHIFVPTISSPAKVERLRAYGAVVHQHGEVFADAFAASQEFLAANPASFIHPFDDPIVIAGAGTCAMELEQQAGALDAVLLACGGGGLSAGAASWFGDRTEIVAVETPGTASYAAAVEHGYPVNVEISGLAADALGATHLGKHPWAALSAVGATSVLVSDDALRQAQEKLWDWLRVVVEPSAAAPLAALLSGQYVPAAGARLGIVLCGANTSR